MAPDELPPGHGLLALRSRWDAMAFEDVADRLVADRIAQVGQGTHDAVIAPRAILPGHPHDEAFNLLVNARTPNRLVWRRGVNRLIDELAGPGEDRIGLGHCCDLCQGL